MKEVGSREENSDFWKFDLGFMCYDLWGILRGKKYRWGEDRERKRKKRGERGIRRVDKIYRY